MTVKRCMRGVPNHGAKETRSEQHAEISHSSCLAKILGRIYTYVRQWKEYNFPDNTTARGKASFSFFAIRGKIQKK
jgi:biotin-(acetyl-CoA carboxylase) ligase